MITARLDMSGFEARRKALELAPMVASKKAVSEGADLVKQQLNARTGAAFNKSNRAHYFWTAQIYPAGGQLSRNPAALIYSRAPKITETFEFGASIHGSKAAALYIPIPGSPAATARRFKGRSIVQAMVQKYGQPLVLPQKDGSGWLMLFKTRTSRTTGNLITSFQKSRKTGEVIQVTAGVSWTPFLVVEPQVTLGRRLHNRETLDQFSRRWPAQFVRLLADELARA